MEKTTTKGLNASSVQFKDTENKQEFYNYTTKWQRDFIKRVKVETNSRKLFFTFKDAIERSEGIRTELDEIFIEYFNYIGSNPLRNNDYFKYLNSYKKGKKLDEKYFRHDLELLHQLYQKTDDNPDYNPFSIYVWQRYVLLMLIKFKGVYSSEMDSVFGVKTDENRDYNPLTNLSRPLRGMLPQSLKLKECDIARAYPTFIDIELNIERKEDVYSLIDKLSYNRLLNTHKETKGATKEGVRAELSVVYGDRVNEVITDERFNNKGQMFRDLTKYEAEYIYKFIQANNIERYVRLHDAVFVLAETSINQMEFGTVKFKLKEVTPPEIIKDIKNFYIINEFGDIETSPHQYKEFFVQENFTRITEQDNDRITIFKDTNNVVQAFNYKTDVVPFLSSNINEYDTTDVENKIAKDNHNAIYGGFLLLVPKELEYKKDAKDTFGIPFKNGYCQYTKGEDEIQVMPYKDVKGFFAPHPTQQRFFEFKQNSEISEFQRFLTMVSTKKDPLKDELTESDEKTVDLFYRMFGYLCHTYKDPSFSPAIILSDEGADDQSRNGGRGKTIIEKAIGEVRTIKIKGGDEFNPSYIHKFADLQKSDEVYALDDVPAGFNYDSLYTNIVGDISCERKGKTAQIIKFKEAPKFVITTNWAVRYDVEASSTHRRFMEFKLTDYFNLNQTPLKVFGHRLFEDWDETEWNKFYNFVYSCVGYYIELGLEAPAYDKDEDNFRAYFYNDSILHEFERIFNNLSKSDGFNVSDFLNQYKDKDNPLRFENYFHHKNVKCLVDAYVKAKNLPFNYVKSERKWGNEAVFEF